jgi:cytochrome c peroxidase
MIKKKEAEIRSEMESISKQLGVSCEQCHKIANFKDGTKKEFHVSQEHMKILQVLKQSGFDGVRGPEANCYLCHRGKLMPDYKTSSESKAP